MKHYEFDLTLAGVTEISSAIAQVQATGLTVLKVELDEHATAGLEAVG